MKSHLSVSPLPLPSNKFLPLQITCHHFRFTLGIFYRPPNMDGDLSLLVDFLSSFNPSLLSNLILLGDFNIDFRKTSPLLTRLLDLTNSLNLNQLVQEPTHFSYSGSPSLIDLLFIPSDLPSSVFILPPVCSSDHLSLQFTIPTSCKTKHSLTGSGYSKVCIYKNADFASANLLSSTPWDDLFSSQDINVCWSIFKEAFLEVMRRFIPSKLVPSSCSFTWGNNDLLACVKKRNHLYHKAKKLKSPIYMSQYRVCRNKTLSYQCKLKASFFNHLSASSSSCKSFWSLFKKLKKKSLTIPTLTHNDLTVTDPISKANLINNFFSQCFNSSVPSLSLSDILPHFLTDCPSDLLCTPENIIQLISQSPSHTSSGPDGISSKMLKATAYSISVPLCKLFNLSLSSGVFPMEWKTSLVISIPKQSSPNPSPSNYRPISLLSLVSKLLEKHVFD